MASRVYREHIRTRSRWERRAGNGPKRARIGIDGVRGDAAGTGGKETHMWYTIAIRHIGEPCSWMQRHKDRAGWPGQVRLGVWRKRSGRERRAGNRRKRPGGWIDTVG